MNMKRSRSRGRKSGGGQQPNRQIDSNGPDVKIRGTASHIFEKYQTLARDAGSAGDRVTAENYLQHAEHYYRVVRAANGAAAAKANATNEAANKQQSDNQNSDSSEKQDDIVEGGEGQELASASSYTAATEGGSENGSDQEAKSETPKPSRRRRSRRSPKAANGSGASGHSSSSEEGGETSKANGNGASDANIEQEKVAVDVSASMGEQNSASADASNVPSSEKKRATVASATEETTEKAAV